VPLPVQPAFAPVGRGGPWPEATRAAGELLSLPLNPRLSEADVRRVAAAVGVYRKGHVPA
jgi:dTDP-4-amino-4,6-dideoxygalactose transaminase